MSDTETTPSDPRDNCPECGERGRFDLGTVQTPACPNRACDADFVELRETAEAGR